MKKKILYGLGALILAGALTLPAVVRNSMDHNLSLRKEVYDKLSKVPYGKHTVYFFEEKKRITVERNCYYLNHGGLKITANDDYLVNEIVLKDYGVKFSLGAFLNGNYFKGVDKAEFNGVKGETDDLDVLFDNLLRKFNEKFDQATDRAINTAKESFHYE